MTNALPAGTRLRGGALLIEEALRREGNTLLYRAYDVPERRAVLLLEFFPENAARDVRKVLLPDGWTEQGWRIALETFSASYANTLFHFEENNTLFCVREYSQLNSSPTHLQTANPHSTVVLSSAKTAHEALSTDGPSNVRPFPQPLREPLNDPATSPTHAPSPTTHKFSWSDILPDILQGAFQGALVGAAGGVVLGALASTVSDADLLAGALRGLWALPIGAIAGGFLAGLRALPSSAPRLATASARTREQQLQSTLAGALKGGLLSVAIAPVLVLAAVFAEAENSPTAILRIGFLSLLCGLFAGGIVGFIRVNPRDRSRH